MATLSLRVLCTAAWLTGKECCMQVMSFERWTAERWAKTPWHYSTCWGTATELSLSKSCPATGTHLHPHRSAHHWFTANPIKLNGTKLKNLQLFVCYAAVLWLVVAWHWVSVVFIYLRNGPIFLFLVLPITKYRYILFFYGTLYSSL